jgi:hypothetical protein
MTWQAPTQSALAILASTEPPTVIDGSHHNAIAVLADVSGSVNSVTELPSSWFENVGRSIFDAALSRDGSALTVLQEALRSLYRRLVAEVADGTGDQAALYERKGRIEQLGDLARIAAERVFPTTAAAKVEPGSHLERFLLVVGTMPSPSSREIKATIKAGCGKDLDEAVVSRLGHKALSLGLVDVVRTGRCNSWELTPRGEKTCEILRERQANHESWDAVVLYPADDELSMSEAISNSGQPERMGVMSSQNKPILYERMDEVELTDLPAPEDWTVGQVASAGPVGAPSIIPSKGNLYEKV